MSEPVVRLEGVTKRYRRPDPGPGLARWRSTEHVVLDGIDLTVEAGETVGILGRNGAGKTTLLRLLGGVTRPSAGRVRVLGRIAPLIGVGVGFHHDLSGDDNLALNGVLLGLTGGEVAARRGDIVAFSGLAEDVLATPVRTWSSGMLMRLAFSVAMHTDPDVLLVDEVLAVGDAAFQRTCLDRMGELQRGGATIVLVSHSLHAVRLLCSRALVLDAGRLVHDGSPEDAVAAYLARLGRDGAAPVGSARAVLSDRTLVDAQGATPGELQHGVPYCLGYDLRAIQPLAAAMVEFVVTHESGAIAHRLTASVGSLAAGVGCRVEVDFRAELAGGTYRLGAAVIEGGEVVAEDRDGLVVYLPPAVGTYGIAELDAVITLAGIGLSDHRSVAIGADP